MSEVDTVTCEHCGILNHPRSEACLLCGVRLDRPLAFDNKSDVSRFFARGGLVEIATARMAGDVVEDDSDVQYSALLDTAVKLALEASWSSMDLVFYRRNPVHHVPTLGVRWPDGPLLAGLELSFLEGGREVLYATMERPGAETRGSNFHWTDEFADTRFDYQLMLYGALRRGKASPRFIKTDPIWLVPDASGASDAPYSLVRPLTRAGVM